MKSRVVGAVLAGVGFVQLFHSVALADYQPPAQRTRPATPTTTTGRRGGCDGDADYPLTILAPKDSIGRSSTRSPAVMWYVPDAQSREILLRLFEMRPDGTRQRLHNVALDSQQGFMEYRLKDSTTLETGRQYQWQVVLFCDRNQPSSTIVSEAMMEMVEISDWGDRLDTLDTTPEGFRQLVEANRWYDALLLLSQFSDAEIKRQLQEELL